MAPQPRPKLGQDDLKLLSEAQQSFEKNGGVCTLLGDPDCQAMQGCKVYPGGVLWKYGGQEKTVKPGTDVLINWRSREGAAGDAGATSVARVKQVFTIPSSSSSSKGGGSGAGSSSSSSKGRPAQDLICIAFHYYWRWGQVFFGADLDPQTALSDSGAELLLQKDLCEDGTWRVSGPGGRGFHVGVINSIAEVRGLVTVKTYDEVVVPDTLPPPQQRQEREQEEQRRLRSYAGRCRSWEMIGGRKTRNDFFYFRYTFDDQRAVFIYADPLARQGRVFSQGEMAMSDFYSGAGIVSAAGRAAGWAVAHVVDRDQNCTSTCMQNFHGRGDMRFNPEHYPHADADVRKMTVQAFADELERGVVTPLRAIWAHFSPPCQELSKRKGERFRNLDELLQNIQAMLRVVMLTRPEFFTLEEVDGFLYIAFRQQRDEGDGGEMEGAAAAAAAAGGAGGKAAAAGGAGGKAPSRKTPPSGPDSVASTRSSSPAPPAPPAAAAAARGGALNSSRSGTPSKGWLRGARGLWSAGGQPQVPPSGTPVVTEQQAAGAGSSKDGRTRRVTTAEATAASLAAAAATVEDSTGGAAGKLQGGKQQQKRRRQQGSAGPAAARQQEEEQDEEEDDHQQQQQEEGPATQAGGVQKVRAVLLVLAGLLRMGYQARVTRLCALHYGVPEARWRIVLFAAQRGCQLPSRPPARYSAPLDLRRKGWTEGVGADSEGDEDEEELDEEGDEEEEEKAGRRAGAGSAAVAVAAAGGRGAAKRARRRIPAWLHDRNVPTDPDMGYGLVWRDMLDYVFEEGYERLPTTVTVGEAWSDLPRLAPEPVQEGQHQQQQQQRDKLERTLGQDTIRYVPEQGQFKIQGEEQVVDVYSNRPDLPVSFYSQYMRTPHYPAQSLMFRPNLLQDHHKYPERADTEAALAGAGWRLHPKGYAGTVLTHNERRGGGLHPEEDRLLTLLERRRLQSIPDTLELRGGTLRDQERMVGNAVPYLMAQAIAEAVYMAARPGELLPNPAPILKGSDPAGTGIATKKDGQQQQQQEEEEEQEEQQQRKKRVRTYYQPAPYAGRELELVPGCPVKQVLLPLPTAAGAAAAGSGGRAVSSGGGSRGPLTAAAGAAGAGGAGADVDAAATGGGGVGNSSRQRGSSRGERVKGTPGSSTRAGSAGGATGDPGSDPGDGGDPGTSGLPGPSSSRKRKGIGSSSSSGGDNGAVAPDGLRAPGSKRSRGQQQQEPQQQPKWRRQQQQQQQHAQEGAPSAACPPAPLVAAAGSGLPPRPSRTPRGRSQQQNQQQQQHAGLHVGVDVHPGGQAAGAAGGGGQPGGVSPTAVRLPVILASPHKQGQR